MIGPYIEPFYDTQSTTKRIGTDLNYITSSLLKIFSCCKKNSEESTNHHGSGIDAIPRGFNMDGVPEQLRYYRCSKKFDTEEMFRDLFLWSVISGYAEMSFIFLLQIRSRIIASLIGAGITSRLVSTKGGCVDQWHKFHKQSKDYEQFARQCIDVCYKQNEQRACQLLLRKIPLFGNVTCMQVS